MALFVRIVDHGSLSAAGRSIGLPKATVSRRLAVLESSIGTALLKRSTRALSLTDAGQRFFERVQRIVRDAEAAQSEIEAANSVPSGTLRVIAAVSIGETMIAPRLIEFMDENPHVRVDLQFGDERVNLIADGFDLVIRTGTLSDSELISRPLAGISRVIVAAPSYLAAHGTPATVRDLERHTAILVRKHLDHWTIGGETVRVSWRMCTGNMTVSRDAARAGLGITRLPEFFVAHDLRDGTLMQVLPQHDVPKTPVTALYPRSTVPSLALRAFLDALQGWSG
jgi:DNA-binding transcriptional LysR family regulator